MKPLVLLKPAYLLIALTLAMVGAIGVAPTVAQSHGPITSDPAAASAERPRLAELLLSDGTLDLTSGFQGSLDASGYRLVSGPGGAPRFAPALADTASAILVPETLGNPGDENWAAGFHTPGTNNTVYALALDNAGNLYAGGEFTIAGGAAANRVAKAKRAPCRHRPSWNGSSWSALGSGIQGDYV